VTNRKYPASIWIIPDVERARVFLQEFAAVRKSGNQMPEADVMRLGNDHTSGTHRANWRRFPWRPITTTRWA
jgi:hypothetical protein